MTEPGTGSDLQGDPHARGAHGDGYASTAARPSSPTATSPAWCWSCARPIPRSARAASRSCIVETEGAQGYRVGRVLDKMGLKAQDTSELFFDDVRGAGTRPARRRRGKGFHQLMGDLPYERTAHRRRCGGRDGRRATGDARVRARAQRLRQAADGAAEHALQAGRDRDAVMASAAPSSTSAWRSCCDGELDTATASMAKWWT